MNVREALDKAAQILTEEQTRPTTAYEYVVRESPNDLALLSKGIAEATLAAELNKRPRKVYEDPRRFAFKSVNFDLLLKVFAQIADIDRTEFISTLLNYVRTPSRASLLHSPINISSFQGHTSALALLAEFCIRTGHLKELLAATAIPKMPTTSLAIMLKEIENMIALNFNLFSDSDLASIPSDLAHLREIADRQTYSARGSQGGPLESNPHFRQGYSAVGEEIVAAIDGITEECSQARYWYLKGALQELPNLQIESDKLKVESFLVKLGFNSEMVKALNAAENDYNTTATPFELKNSLGHLRSFLEHLHREAAKSIATAAGNKIIDRWGNATVYLREQGCLTRPQEDFVTSLYKLLSDESVHPLTTEREYARLLRNVVIEYGVVFLTLVDKRGVKIA